MNNALQMLGLPDLFKSESAAARPRSAETPGTQSFDSIYQSKTYGGESQSKGSGGRNRSFAESGFAGNKDNHALSAVKSASVERRNLTKPEGADLKPSNGSDVYEAKSQETKVEDQVVSKDNRGDNKLKKKMESVKKSLKEAEANIDQAVQNGTLTSEQAAELKSALAEIEQQLSALMQAAAEGSDVPEKANGLVEKLEGVLKRTQSIEFQMTKPSEIANVKSEQSESQTQSKSAQVHFDKVLEELKNGLEELKTLNAGTASPQPGGLQKETKASFTEATATSNGSTQAVKPTNEDTASAETVMKIQNTELEKTKSSSLESKTLTTATVTSDLPRPEGPSVQQDPAKQQGQNTGEGQPKTLVAAEVMSSKEDVKGAVSKADVETAVKPVEVSKLENTLVKSAKLEAPQPMKRLESSVMQQIQNMMQNSVKVVKAGSNEMVLRLKPESLGQVSLKLNMEGGNLSAEFKVENLMVKAMIESNMTDLKNALTEKGYNVSGFDVSLGQGQTNSQQESREQERRYQNSGRDLDSSADSTKGFEKEMQSQTLDDRSSVINTLG